METKDYSHFASIKYKKEIVKNLTLQTGISFDNQNTLVKNKVPLYYYAMNEESPTYKQDTVVSNYILEPYLYVNWNIRSSPY